MSHHGAGADDRVFADGDIRGNYAIRADPYAVFHDNFSAHMALVDNRFVEIVMPVIGGPQYDVLPNQHVIAY